MNFRDFKDHIERICYFYHDVDDFKVGIVIKRLGSIGSTPLMDIKSITLGFDWNTHKILIDPQEELEVVDKSQYNDIMAKYDKIGLVQMENRRLKAEIKKLKGELK